MRFGFSSSKVVGLGKQISYSEFRQGVLWLSNEEARAGAHVGLV